jgi:energy-converting hydrogenase Eha subunit A
MERPSRPSFEPAGAGGLLVATTVILAGIGALVGWALGSVGVGAAVGTAAGIPAGIFAVYRRYREYFS